MRIAIVGGGASGMAAAYWLDKQGHHVTVLEKQPNFRRTHSDAQQKCCAKSIRVQ